MHFAARDLAVFANHIVVPVVPVPKSTLAAWSKEALDHAVALAARSMSRMRVPMW